MSRALAARAGGREMMVEVGSGEEWVDAVQSSAGTEREEGSCQRSVYVYVGL